jgi:large subunit ribosomal protein L10
MSKYVKDLIIKDLRERLNGVDDALLVDVIGMKNEKTVQLRQRLRQKNIRVMVVKNSLARRATEGTRLGSAFDRAEGTLALIWGGDDVVSLAKEIVKISQMKEFEPFKPKGGTIDGQPLSAEQVTAVSKWPSRQEQLSILSGQILSPGAKLSSQLLGPGAKLASQIKKKGDDAETAS